MTVMPDDTLDAVVVGAGYTGLAVLHLLRERGLRVHGYDAAGNVGGTWWWHAFPGSHLDTDGALYQYFFSEDLYREWGWSERHPAGYEVQRWFRFVADRLDLRRHLTLATTVTRATLDDGVWTVRTDRAGTVRARALVACTGRRPAEVAADTAPFDGTVLRTASWREDRHDLAGLRVGILGTTAAAIHLVPAVVDDVAALTVVADRPRDVVPRVNPVYGWREREDYRSRFADVRDGADDPTDDPTPIAADRDAMRARLDGDPRLVELLVPTGPAGSAGPVTRDGGWLEAFARPHVELVAPDGLAGVRPEGLVLADGTRRDLDVLVVTDDPDAGPPAVDALALPASATLFTPVLPRPGAASCVPLYREARRLADGVAARLVAP